jgi:thiol-disulfide isomerase/thioredoxin
MKAVGWLLLASICTAGRLAGAAAPARSIEFHRSIEEAKKAAKVERPTVILFGASWCTWCRKMETDTLTDPKVTKTADRFLWVKIDVDQDQELAVRYGVEGVPVAVVIDGKGRVLGTHSGFLSPDKFLAFLSQSLANPHPEELLPDLLNRFLQSHEAADVRETTKELVGELARPARVDRDEILAAVQKKGPSVWPLLLGLMADERLAIRAAAAGALKHASKGELPFHPFAEIPVRQQQIAGWQKWLASRRWGS